MSTTEALMDNDETRQHTVSRHDKNAKEPDKEDVTEANINTLSTYFREIGFVPLLTAEEELDLAYQVQKGNAKARCKMIESNLRLVVKIAKRYVSTGMDLLDLIEEGNIGLMHAVEKFNPQLGYRFSTYSVWWIRQSIERAIMNQHRLVRLPVHVIQNLHTYRKHVANLTKSLGHEPTSREIAEAMQKPLQEIEELANMDHGTLSLDAPLDDSESNTFIDTVVDENNIDPMRQIQADTMIQLVDMWLSKLEDVQSEVLSRRFGLRGYGKSTLEDISQVMQINREKVRNIQSAGLRKLREILYQHGMLEEVAG